MRIMRLALGIWIAVVAVKELDWITGLLAVFFLYQAVTDTGCCSSAGCRPRPQRNAPATGEAAEPIDYEIVE